jgi:acetyltransferase-like isoleucine patch superfamily enzyme
MLRIKRQLGFMLVFLHNAVYNFLPFFVVKNAYLKLLGNQIGHLSTIHTFVRLVWFRGLVIGDHCTINYGCLLSSAGGITLGNNVMIGHMCKLYTVGHDIDSHDFALVQAPIVIHDDAVVFPNTIVLPGVQIGRGAVVLNGSLVSRDVSEYEVVGGNPAKFIRKRLPGQTYRLDHNYWFINS